jgi:predicted Zn-dependent protease
VRLRPNLAEAWLALARGAAQRSDWRNLEDLSNQLKKYAPNSAEPYLLHATARMNLGDPIGAEADLMNLQKIAPQSPMYFLKMGELRLAQKRLPEAENMFHQGLSRDPNSLEAIRGLVHVDQAKQKPAEALVFVQEQIKRNSKSPDLYLMQAELQLQAKQPQQAEESLNQAIALNKDFFPAIILLAQVQTANGQLAKAIDLTRPIGLANHRSPGQDHHYVRPKPN